MEQEVKEEVVPMEDVVVTEESEVVEIPATDGVVHENVCTSCEG